MTKRRIKFYLKKAQMRAIKLDMKQTVTFNFDEEKVTNISVTSLGGQTKVYRNNKKAISCNPYINQYYIKIDSETDIDYWAGYISQYITLTFDTEMMDNHVAAAYDCGCAVDIAQYVDECIDYDVECE
jgi:hypothetical protein